MAIDIITTGGTIAARKSEARAGTTPTLEAPAFLRGRASTDADVNVHELLGVPSSWMGMSEIRTLVSAIDDVAARGSDGVLVVEGTDAMEEVAFAVELLRDSPVPVAFTGSMRLPGELGFDGEANVENAVQYLRHAPVDSTVVVMDGQVHAARCVRKSRAALPGAFDSAPYGPIGMLVEGRYHPYRPAPVLHRRDVPRLVGAALAQVLLVWAVVGEDLEWLSDVVRGYDGVVVAGMGAGHVSRRAAEHIADVARSTPVVIASRTGVGCTLEATYDYIGSEVFFAESTDAVLARRVAPIKARILLAASIGSGVPDPLRLFRSIDAHL